MYSYILLNEKNISVILKKVTRQILLFSMLYKLLLCEIIFILILGIAIMKSFNLGLGVYIAVAIISILIHIVIFEFYLEKKINKYKVSEKRVQMDVSFSEDGIEFKQETLMESMKWHSIKEVLIYKDYLILMDNSLNLLGHILIFNGFNVEKEVIISEIEKYKEVRRF